MIWMSRPSRAATRFTTSKVCSALPTETPTLILVLSCADKALALSARTANSMEIDQRRIFSPGVVCVVEPAKARRDGHISPKSGERMISHVDMRNASLFGIAFHRNDGAERRADIGFQRGINARNITIQVKRIDAVQLVAQKLCEVVEGDGIARH